MSEERTRKGIVDPWRIVEPLRKPVVPPTPLLPGQKVNLDQIDFDADLRVPQKCAIRSRSGSILVHSKQIETGNDALRDLVRCLFQLVDKKEPAAEMTRLGIAFAYGTRQWRISSMAPSARLATSDGYEPATCLHFLQQTYDDGMLHLIKFLNASSRRPGPAGADILKRWGVVPMMR